jgi:hypothetical protein
VVPCPKIFTTDNKVLSIDNNTVSKVSMYPTVTTTELNITGVNNAVEYTIYTQQGAKVLSGILNGKYTINVSDLKAGMYIISINNNANPTYLKFIKE